MNIYVGNLSYDLTENELLMTFESFGKVESATIIKDRNSSRSKGFGFVNMPSDEEARSAIDGLKGKRLKGRMIRINEARPRSQRLRNRHDHGDQKGRIREAGHAGQRNGRRF